MVIVGTGKSGTRFLKTDWPFEEGLEAGTTKTSDKITNLIPEEGSNLSYNDRVGIE